MHIRDRIRELRRVRAADLVPNPKNWRTHPRTQHDALRAVLAEIGYAAALVARETGDGRLMLIDGHLRAETTPETLVPVLVLDVSEEEADKLLATLDPVSAMAGADREKLSALVAGIQTESAALKGLLDRLAPGAQEPPPGDLPEELEAAYSIIVECDSEQAQVALLERFSREGLRCRAFVV